MHCFSSITRYQQETIAIVENILIVANFNIRMQCILFVHLHATCSTTPQPLATCIFHKACTAATKCSAILFIVLQFFKQFHFQFGTQFYFFVCSSVFWNCIFTQAWAGGAEQGRAGQALLE